MKRFISKFLKISTLVIVSLIISLAMLFETAKLKFEYGSYAKSKNFKECYTKINAPYSIVIGNSKALSSIDEEILSKALHQAVYNLAYSSSSITHSKFIVKSMISRKIKPTYLFLEVSWFSFNSNRTFLHISSLVPVVLNTNISTFNTSDISTLITNGGINCLFNYIKTRDNKDETKYSDAWNKMIKDPNEFDKTGFYSVFPDGKAKIDNQLYNDLIEIVKLCNTNNIKLVFFTSPENREYQNHQKDRVLIYSKLKSLAFLNELPFYDFSNFTLDEFGNSILADSHHVYNDKWFTELFVKEILGES
jgi:hypothetical protein